MKTFKGWQKSGTDLAEYLGEEPVRIDEELHRYIGISVVNNFSMLEFTQHGKPEFHEMGVGFYITTSEIGDKYFYLGILPSFV